MSTIRKLLVVLMMAGGTLFAAEAVTAFGPCDPDCPGSNCEVESCFCGEESGCCECFYNCEEGEDCLWGTCSEGCLA